MAKQSNRVFLRTMGLAALSSAILSTGWTAASAASPEDEIARLNRVRQSLFEDLVKARADAAATRAELEAMSKARDQAEAELARMKLEAASAKSPDPQNVPATASVVQSRKVQVDPRAPGRSSSRPAAAPSVPRSASSLKASEPRRRKTPMAPSARVIKPVTASVVSRPAPRSPEGSGLPSVLRLQDPQ
jgi:hypothetical protein